VYGPHRTFAKKIKYREVAVPSMRNGTETVSQNTLLILKKQLFCDYLKGIRNIKNGLRVENVLNT